MEGFRAHFFDKNRLSVEVVFSVILTSSLASQSGAAVSD